MPKQNNKTRCIAAIKKLIKERYEKHKVISCPLCPIFTSIVTDCGACPSSVLEKWGSQGCGLSETYYDYRHYGGISYMEARAQYWKNRLPKLKSLDQVHFTMKRNKKLVYEIMKDD